MNTFPQKAALAAALLALALAASSCNTATATGVATSVLNQMNTPTGGGAKEMPRVTVTGRVLGPNGKAPGRQLPVHACRNGLQVMRHQYMNKTMLYRCPNSPGNSRGVVNKEGVLDFQGQAGSTYDFIIWATDLEPLIVRNVRAPGDIGTVRIKGYNKTLRQVEYTHRKDLSPL